MLQSSCCYLSKVLLQRRGRGYAKVIHIKNRELKNGHKSVRDIENNGYSDARLKKREEKRDE